jgi:Tfp pilus assembly protein PilV
MKNISPASGGKTKFSVQNKLKKIKRGFSFLEVIISVFVLSTGIIGVFAVINSSMIYSLNASNQQIAVMLAQEGIELTRNIRDNNWAKRKFEMEESGSSSISSFDNFPSGDSNNCRIDKNSIDMNNSKCSNGVNHKKLSLDGNNFYIHGGSPFTKFSRKIEVDFDDSEDTVIITSVVIWNRNGNDFPSIADCNVVNKCVFNKATLTKWGEEL